MSIQKKTIEINPRVIQHLGKDLITSSDVAVVELIKNSIDAGAPQIALRVYDSINAIRTSKKHLAAIPESAYSLIPTELWNEAVCLVEDTGKGMNEHQLEDGFLTVGTNIKNDEDIATLGEKGIGRLATQRLGRALLVETVSQDDLSATLYTFIDWSGVFEGNTSVDYLRVHTKNTKSYTRLWVIGIDLTDFIDISDQLQFGSETEYTCNRELRSAMNFLISPFSGEKGSPEVTLEYNEIKVNISFVCKMLDLAESTHYFSYDSSGLSYGLDITPWYIERIHLATVKTEAFNRLKKGHSYYADLLKRNSDRIAYVLKKHCSDMDLQELLVDFFRKAIPCKKSETSDFYQIIWNERARACAGIISKLLPIHGKIYSFKQNSTIGKDIIISSVIEHKKNTGQWKSGDGEVYEINNLKNFLKNYNGIKLYRGDYRIGFLGNKENDWIKLQQFRTKGQQWYRFDLGNTLGYVSLNDPMQKNIREISSRLDIVENEYSVAFKTLIDIVFNSLFYDLNRTANGLIKTILEEEGLLNEPLSRRIKKNDDTIKRVLNQNKQMLALIHKVNEVLSAEVVHEGEHVVIPKQRYSAVASLLGDIDRTASESLHLSKQTAQILVEANEQMKVVEVQAYNNYKLMANGLITETITHELHSVSKTSIDEEIPNHFDALKSYHREHKTIPVYNAHVKPIKTGYQAIAGKISSVSDMYAFLENTFIHKGTYDEFVDQNIASVVNDVFSNLLKTNKLSNVSKNCPTGDLSWYVPKGVLVHVFYNLFANSMYWIDKRREYAKNDPKYFTSETDEILVEPCGDNELIISDSGLGVSRDMEDILFEPLQSGKPHGTGRGMGLYIVRELMRSFGGDIHLLNDRNKYGNRYKFILTLIEGKK